MNQYAVIADAGTSMEQVIKTFADWSDARKYAKQYASLQTDVVRLLPDGSYTTEY